MCWRDKVQLPEMKGRQLFSVSLRSETETNVNLVHLVCLSRNKSCLSVLTLLINPVLHCSQTAPQMYAVEISSFINRLSDFL